MTLIAPLNLKYDQDGWVQYEIPKATNIQFSALLQTFDRAVTIEQISRPDAHQLVGKKDSAGKQFRLLTALPESFIEIEPSAQNGETVDLLSLLKEDVRQEVPLALHDLPFICGYVGFISYDAGEEVLIDRKAPTDSKLPLACTAYYSWSYLEEHDADSALLTFSPFCSDNKQRELIQAFTAHSLPTLPASFKDFRPYNDEIALKWSKSQSFEDYARSFSRIKDYILAGDCYQVNLTQRFEADLPTDFQVSDFYLAQQTQRKNPYACFMRINARQHLLSFSPEQFIASDAGNVQTKPIKGTLPSQPDSNEQVLANSLKDRAENLMIVDLLRNDLSKVCQLNSVRVPELFKVEKHKHIFHMVSTITGKLKQSISPYEALIHCFPGGSITGAPKKRAMEVIHELEQHPRDAYCGSFFMWSDSGNFDSSILIRTIVHHHNKLYCWAGGGIVADSEVEKEYQESLEKVRPLTGIDR